MHEDKNGRVEKVLSSKIVGRYEEGTVKYGQEKKLNAEISGTAANCVQKTERTIP